MTLDPGDTTDPQVRALVAVMGQRLAVRQALLTHTLTEEIRSISDLDLDQPLLDLLDASVDSNINTIVHLLINAIPVERIHAPTAAVEYALRLAQRGVPAYSLVRAYHLGKEYLTSVVLEELRTMDLDADLMLRALVVVSREFYEYIDWICLHLLDLYEAERGRWATASGNVHAAMLQDLLAGGSTGGHAFEAETRYRLDQHHVGLVLWSDDEDGMTDALVAMERVGRTLATSVGGGMSPLFSAVDRTTAWMWIGRGQREDPVDPRVVADALAKHADLRATVGLPAAGLDGFRRTHRQAVDAFELVRSAQERLGPVVAFGDRGIAVLSMLRRQPGELARWVGEVLGPVGAPTPAAARSRATLGAWLDHDRNFQAAAEVLSVHRNTVKYRIGRIQDELGPRLDDRRVDFELALLACRLLGDEVLTDGPSGRRR